MTETLPDRLKANLISHITVLEKIYDSDHKLISNIYTDTAEFDIYDAYLEEQDLFLEELDRLDSEYDLIIEAMKSDRTKVDQIPADTGSKLKSLISELNGKVMAVQDIEKRVKTVVDALLGERKNEIAESRKNTRVINNHYRQNAYRTMLDNSAFDIQN